jgi:dolichyl-phosphate beta-glucosyltransferase
LEKSTLSLTVVIPAYNEEERLPVMLEESTKYLEARVKKDAEFTYEMILADDGSMDTTTKVRESF